MIPWTILAVKKQAASDSEKYPQQSALRFPAASRVLPRLVQHFQKTSNNLARLALQSSIEIHILDVVPVGLDTVVVSVDEEALSKLEAANQKFRKGGSTAGNTLQKKAHQRVRSLGTAIGATDRWESAIRSAFSAQHIIHDKDFLPLPLSAHPITHVAPPPAIVELCEPVSQGVVLPETRIVVIPTKDQTKHGRTSVTNPTLALTANGSVPEEDEDTSNEQFFSAAEDKSPASKGGRASAESESDVDPATSTEEDTDLSDGEPETLGLSLPSLPSQPTGTFSSLTAATPRVGNPFLDGIASPGSAVSGYSMSTVVGGGTKGKLFETQGLLAPILGESLHPKPLQEEDEEARAYVDSNLLSKTGCFSGDWVRIEASSGEGLNALGSWGFNAHEHAEQQLSEWRVVKLFAFPGLTAKRPRYAINKANHRFSGSFMFPHRSAPKVYLSPLTLANLGGPKNVRISKLELSPNKRASRQSFAGLISHYPPVATDVTLQKFSTPIAHEKSLDSSLRLALESHFKQRARIVKQSDLIGIPIDTKLGKALSGTVVGEDEALERELLMSNDSASSLAKANTERAVAWFKVGEVRVEREADESPWGSLAVVRAETTKLAQAGDFHGRLPNALHNCWPYYLGSKRFQNANEYGNLEEQQLQPPKPYVSQIRRRLRELMSAATSPQAIHLSIPPAAILLNSTRRYIGKATVAADACSDLGLHCFPIDGYAILSEGGGGGGDVNTAGLLEARVERGLLSGSEHTALLLNHIDVLTADRMVATVKDALSKARILIATTTNVDKIPDGMRSLFTHELEMSAPDESEREGLLRSLLQDRSVPLAPDVDLSSVAMKTAALVAGDLADVIDRAVVARQERFERLAKKNNERLEAAARNSSHPETGTQVTLRDVHVAAGPVANYLTAADFTAAVDAARKNFADSIGAPKIPNVAWDDVGGLTNVKDAVMETIQLPLERPELFAKGMKKRSGILFYGPPGTGKTLLAKAIATEFSLNFFSVKGPELLNMYIGESEANVRRVFQRARDARPCVVFFDELDSVAPKRGNQGDSGGVMDRIVSQLLAELDGMSSGGSDDGKTGSSGVFVIGATNRPDLLDQALLRPGRFDKMLYLGVSDTHEKQLTILEALTRKFSLHSALSLRSVANSIPLTYTGADLYALCSDAMLKAISRRAAAVDAKVRAINAKRAAARPSPRGTSSEDDAPLPTQRNQRETNPISVAYFFDHLATAEDTEVMVEEQDFTTAHTELVPSVSSKELEHYERVRAVFERVEEGRAGAEGKMAKVNGQNDSSDEDYVLKTSQLSLQDDTRGTAKVNGVVAAKGKGKAPMLDNASEQFGFGNVTDEDSELYDT